MATWPSASCGAPTTIAALDPPPAAELDTRAARLTDQLLALEPARAWKRALQRELVKAELTTSDLQAPGGRADRSPLYCLADRLGVVAAVKRAVIELHTSAAQAEASASAPSSSSSPASSAASSSSTAPLPPAPDAAERLDELDGVLAARARWEAETRDEMLRLAAELRQPLAAPRPPERGPDPPVEGDPPAVVAASEPDPPSGRRARLSVSRFLYDGSDLLRALQAIPAANRAADEPEWGSIRPRLQCAPPALAELSPAAGQVGLDELFPAERPQFAADKSRVGELVLSHHSRTMARQFAKTGCPAHLRAQVWAQSLGVAATQRDRALFRALLDQTEQRSLLTDELLLLDLRRATDRADFFAFEDELRAALLAFSRDPHVRAAAPRVNGAVRDPAAPGGEPVPPSGVLPFAGLAMYLAPLAYAAADGAELFLLFRAMYARYWSRLNRVSADAGGLLRLCRLFEALVARAAPAAAFHLANAGIAPLDVAFPWLHSAFAGVLDVRQLLLLWDRVVGFDSLDVLAHLAAALFRLRAAELQRARSREAVAELFAELLDVQVVPLLQSFLFLFPEAQADASDASDASDAKADTQATTAAG